MKKLVSIFIGCMLLSGLSLVSCGNATLDVVNKFIEADDTLWKTGDATKLLAIEDPNIVIHMFGGFDMKGSQAHTDFIKNTRTSVPSGFKHVFSDATGTGNIGAFRYSEEFNMNGKDWKYDACMFLHIMNGKVTEIYFLYDSLTLMKAYGLAKDVPPPAAPKKK
jgi:ketosteroid isomerase-like protein